MVDLADTTPEGRDVQILAYRSMSPTDRVAIALQLSDEMFAVARAGIHARQPLLTEAEITVELHRILGHDELFG